MKAIMRFNTIPVLSIIVCYVCSVLHSAPIIYSPWGTIEGVDIEGKDGRRFSGYLGIPFALAPIGKLRWAMPQSYPVLKKGETFAATTLPLACPQPVFYSGKKIFLGEDEDCLKLSVYVPLHASDPSESITYSVMVWIHGGGFIWGQSALYRPDKLVADSRVIVVTIQYRLGALGFLYTADPNDVPRNLGLWDQTLALRWVKDNIQAFGGDPETITIFGESAGAISVGAHLVSPASGGLFKRAILQSGQPVALLEPALFDPKSQVFRFKLFSEIAGCPPESFSSDKQVIQCLRGLSAQVIVNATISVGKQLKLNFGSFIASEDGKFVHDLRNVLQSSVVSDIDVLHGFTNNEGAVLLLFAKMHDASVERFVPPQLFLEVLETAIKINNKGESNDILLKVLEFYYRQENSGTNTSVPLGHLLEVYGDCLLGVPGVEFLRLITNQPQISGTRYQYLFDHNASFNQNGIAPGTHHTDELLFEFEILDRENLMFKRSNPLTPEEEELSDQFVKMVASFARTGNPSTPFSQVLGADWPQFDRKDEAYLSLSLTPQVKSHVYANRVALWLQLVPDIMKSIQELQQPADNAKQRADKDEL